MPDLASPPCGTRKPSSSVLSWRYWTDSVNVWAQRKDQSDRGHRPLTLSTLCIDGIILGDAVLARAVGAAEAQAVHTKCIVGTARPPDGRHALSGLGADGASSRADSAAVARVGRHGRGDARLSSLDARAGCCDATERDGRR